MLVLGSGCKDDNGGSGGPDDTDAGDGGGGNRDAGNDARVDGGLDGGDGGGGNDNADGGDATMGGGDADGGDAGGDAGDSAIPNPTIASPTTVSFGPVPCGGDAPANAQAVTLTNSGATAVTWTATLSSTSAFGIQGETDGSASGTIAPNTSTTVNVTAAAVSANATAGQAITATLTVTTNLPAPNATITIPVSIVPQGAHLVLSPAGGADWLSVQLNQTATPLPITVQNTGNAPALVTVTQPSVAAFDLLGNGGTSADTFTVPAANNGAPGTFPLSATFTPTVVGPYASSAGLMVAGNVCNGGTPSIASIPFEGFATGNGFTAEAIEPLEERVFCNATGGALPKATIKVGNYTATELTVNLSLATGGGSHYELSTNALTIAAGGTQNFDVTLKESAASGSNAVPRQVRQDAITIAPANNNQLSSLSVPLSTTVTGAILSVGTLAPFNSALADDPETQQLTFSNSGNWPASPVLKVEGTNAALFTKAEFLNPAAVPAGASASTPGTSLLDITFTPEAGDANTKAAMLTIAQGPNDAYCQALPGAVMLEGTPTTPGFSLLTPSNGTAAFGSGGFVDCPAGNLTPGSDFPGGSQFITFENTGSQDLVYTAVLSDNAPFTIVTGATGTVQPNNVGTIEVQANAIEFPVTSFAARTGMLSIDAMIPGRETTYDIPLTLTPRGAVLSVSEVSTGFGTVNVTASSQSAPLFTLSNGGNNSAAVTLTSTVTGTAGSSAKFTISSDASGTDEAILGVPATIPALTLAPSTPIAFTGIFDPVSGTPNPTADRSTSTLTTTLATSDPVCAAIVNPLAAIAGTGTDADVTINTSPIDFGLQQCGTNVPPPRTVIVNNYGNQSLNIDNVVLAAGENSPFLAYIGAQSITGPGVNVTVPRRSDQGTPGTAAVTILPKFIAAGATDGLDESDTLTITTTVPGGVTTDEDIVISREIACP